MTAHSCSVVTSDVGGTITSRCSISPSSFDVLSERAKSSSGCLSSTEANLFRFRKKLPWFLNALPSADCAKGGHGAYTTGVDLNGFESGVIRASKFRIYHTPVNKQGDYVNSIQAAREFAARVSESLKVMVGCTEQGSFFLIGYYILGARVIPHLCIQQKLLHASSEMLNVKRVDERKFCCSS